MMKRGKASRNAEQDGSTTEMKVRYAPLAGVFAGVVILVVGLACLYLVVHAVGTDHGGSCVSGGPYEIAPGHECGESVFELGFGGAFGMIAGFALFLWSSHVYGRHLVVAAASGLSWTAFWGGLGAGFVSIASELPAGSETGSEFNTVGTVFLVLAVFGVVLAAGTVVFSLLKKDIDYPNPTVNAWAAFFAAILAAFAGIGIAAVCIVPGM